MASWYSVFRNCMFGLTEVSRYIKLSLVELELDTQLHQNFPTPMGWRWGQELGIMQLRESLASAKKKQHSRTSELESVLLIMATYV